MPIIPINLADTGHIDSILSLSNKVFWEWFLSQKELTEQILLCENNHIKNALVIIKNTQLVGYWICYLGGKWWWKEVKIDDRFTDINNYGYVSTIIIDPIFRWQNYGSILLEYLLKNLKMNWDKQALLHVWNESPKDSSKCFFLKHGAIPIKTYDFKWYQDSIENKWECSLCGNPCICSSTEMLINL